MTLEQIQAIVTEKVRLVQEKSGRKAGNIGPSTRPLTDLAGFKSVNAVEATVEIDAELGAEVDSGCHLFKTLNGRINTIREVAEQLMKSLSEKKKRRK